MTDVFVLALATDDRCFVLALTTDDRCFCLTLYCLLPTLRKRPRITYCGPQVEVSKLRVFSMDEDGGSLLTSRVDPQLKEAQHKVGVWVTMALFKPCYQFGDKAPHLNLFCYQLGVNGFV